MVHSLSIKLREGTFMSQALKSLYELGQCLKLGKLPLPSRMFISIQTLFSQRSLNFSFNTHC